MLLEAGLLWNGNAFPYFLIGGAHQKRIELHSGRLRPLRFYGNALYLPIVFLFILSLSNPGGIYPVQSTNVFRCNYIIVTVLSLCMQRAFLFKSFELNENSTLEAIHLKFHC